ncbi:MAG: AAA family ATPase [Anaerolineae bacterium]|nr:AAA family ATPase [Anaerolineae bacterium]
MDRKTDLEEHIRESYRLINEYETIYRVSSDPKEQARCRQIIDEQWTLLESYLGDYAKIVQDMPQDILEIASSRPSRPFPALPSVRPYNNLPRPDYVEFVGREDELEWLRQRLSSEDRAWQIALTGIGGVGKSALALTIAHEYRTRYGQLPAEDRFEAIVWVSAKEQVLSAYGREQADLPEQIMHTLEDVYTAISQTLEREDITRALPQDQANLVDKALRRQRTLLVMDNMESVRDERIKPFLRKLPPPTKALITSREWTNVADQWALTGLSAEEADALMQQESQTRGVELREQERKRIFELTHGLPLPIKLGIARIASGESFAAVERWLGDATGDIPEYCINGQIALARERDPNAWIILLACSLFDRGTGASREALGYTADLSIADRDAALSQLQRLFLINRTQQDRFWVLPLASEYMRAASAGTNLGPCIDRWLDWLVQFIQTDDPASDWKSEYLQMLDLEYPNLVSGIHWCRTQARWDTLFRLARGTWDYPYLSGLFSEMEEILNVSMLAAQHTWDEQRAGQVEFELGKLARLRMQYDKAEKHFKRAEEIARKYGDHAVLGKAWSSHIAALLDIRQTVKTEIERNSLLVEAERMAYSLLTLGEQHNDLYLQTLAVDRLSSIEGEKSNFDRASDWLDKAEDWIKKLGADRREPSITYHRGRNLMKQGDYQGAESYVRHALSLHTLWKERRYAATEEYVLAEIYVKTGQVALARQHAQEARDLYERLGIEQRRTEAEELLHRLAE